MPPETAPVKLSICIPTFNRAEFLRQCLASVIPQVRERLEVEVIVSDNASQDGTASIISEFQRQYPQLRYYRNDKNLGFAGNQQNCFRYASGQHIAILCDDDLYMLGMITEILRVVGMREYAFVALNYFSFLNDPARASTTDFAPDDDVVFARAYDVMNHPSVGHFSGFVFNARLAREALAKTLAGRAIDYFEKHRGVVSEVASRSTAASTLPAFFVGKRLLAARIPPRVDYDGLTHLTLDYYEMHRNLFDEGMITSEDLAYRTRLVLSWMPRAIGGNAYRMTDEKLLEVTEQLKGFFGEHRRFKYLCLPLLVLARNQVFKLACRNLHAVRRYLKYGSGQ